MISTRTSPENWKQHPGIRKADTTGFDCLTAAPGIHRARMSVIPI